MNEGHVFIDKDLSEREQLILEFLLRAALVIVGGDGASVMLMNRERNAITMKGVAGKGENLESKIGITLKLGERVAGQAALTGEAIIIVGDVHKHKGFSDLKKYQDIKSGMAVPLKLGNTIAGVINLKRTEMDQPVGQAEVKLMSALGSVAATLLG
ncbi:MAG: GAF domain-containing protein [Candidatus Aureabacteria bacterium]|nr:GAF domain-containing protein [Candidatus Auribacterota bacterium]